MSQDIMELNKATLRLFKSYLRDPGNGTGFKSELIKYGVYVKEEISKRLFDEIKDQYGIDGFILNQTFHKSLNTVAETDIINLYIQQIVHYFSTYGFESLGITDGKVYIPDEKLRVPVLEEGTTLTYISKIEESELREKLTDLVQSGIALSKQTIKDIITLSDYINVKIYEIKNKEVRTALYSKYNIVPKDGVEFIRFLIFKLTGNTLLIKDNITLNMLSSSEIELRYKYLTEYRERYNLKELAKIFNRYKEIFIALKVNKNKLVYSFKIEEVVEINKIINLISKLSKKYHEPFVNNDKLSNVAKYLNSNDLTTEELNKENIWKVIRAGNYINFDTSNSPLRLYKIRNGKIFTKQNRRRVDDAISSVSLFYNNITDRVKKNIKDKTIYIPDNIDYAVPQSEKKFIGNIPFDSTIFIDKTKGFLVGIHWNNLKIDELHEERVDIDLKLLSNKYQIGWNARYRDRDSKLLYTGDMTDAIISKGGASEYIYIDGSLEDALLTFKVNLFTSHVVPVPFDIIIAYAPNVEKIKDQMENYVINPNDIICKFSSEIEVGKREQSIGIFSTGFTKNKFIITQLCSGNVPVSRNGKLDDQVRFYLNDYLKVNYSLKNVLMKAGVNIVDSPEIEIPVKYLLIDDGVSILLIKPEELEKYDTPYKILDNEVYKKEKVPVDIDLSVESLNKSTIIDLFKE